MELLSVPLQAPQAVDTTALRVWRPPAAAKRPALLLGHGAGSAFDHPVLTTIGEELSARGVTVGAFNFAYRQAGRRSPDTQRRLCAAFRDVLGAFREQLNRQPVVLGGRSLGGRIASHLAAEGSGDGLVLLGYPLHAPTRAGQAPARLRTEHWPQITVPVLFVQGTRDRLCDLELLERERARLSEAYVTLHQVDGADHAFGVRKRDGRSAAEVRHEIVATIDRWLEARATAVDRAPVIR